RRGALGDDAGGEAVAGGAGRDRGRRSRAPFAEERGLIGVDVGDLADEGRDEWIAGIVIDGIRDLPRRRRDAGGVGAAEAEDGSGRVPPDLLVEEGIAVVALLPGLGGDGREGQAGDDPVDLDGAAGDVPDLVM